MLKSSLSWNIVLSTHFSILSVTYECYISWLFVFCFLLSVATFWVFNTFLWRWFRMHFEYFPYLSLLSYFLEFVFITQAVCGMVCVSHGLLRCSALLFIFCLFICFYFHFAVSSKISNKTKSKAMAKENPEPNAFGGWEKTPKLSLTYLSSVQAVVVSFCVGFLALAIFSSSDLFCLLYLPGLSFRSCLLLFLRFGTC